jgi:hypothetical protein
VRVTYNYNWLNMANIVGTKASTPLTSTATMRIEQAPQTPYHRYFRESEPTKEPC